MLNNPNASPSQIPGIQPATLAQWYGFNPTQGGSNQTVAVVVAYDVEKWLPNDLNVYRQTFGLPACTEANGCLTFLPQSKKVHPTDPKGLWPLEGAIDAEMVSAVCPNCKIMVAEAQDQHIANMSVMDDMAAQAGATEISNSWSLPESNGALQYASHFVHPGVPITAGAGDGGYAVGFPADVGTVISVGGTTLDLVSQQESVWSLTGSGCSTSVAKPSYQTDSGCAYRTLNDVSIVADPATGVAIYTSKGGGWLVMGGTSIGSPMIAAMYALQGNGSSVNNAASIYAHPSDFNAILTGSNGTCSPLYLCTATGGYSGPSGVGTPHGTGGF